jgi:hypothetical protein
VSSAPPVNFTRRRASIRKFQGDFVLKEHSARLCFKCFTCFIVMLQLVSVLYGCCKS